jgi:hypothetical protein
MKEAASCGRDGHGHQSALQVPQLTDVTNELGEYRLTALPLGTYTVQYELAGFGTLRREDIRLTAGFTARLDIRLKVEL